MRSAIGEGTHMRLDAPDALNETPRRLDALNKAP